MKKKKLSKSSKRSLLLFGGISLFVISYFIYNLFLYTYNIYSLKNREIELSRLLEEKEHKSKILKTEIEKLKDPIYIARFARENYQYSKDGEIIIRFQEKEDEKETITKKDDNSIFVVGSFVIVVILTYVIIKNKKRK